MSSTEQTQFDERVAEFLEATSGMSFIPKHAKKLYDTGEYEELERFMSETEANLSMEHFHNADALC